MANVKITDFSAAGALTGAELLELVQSGANVKVSLANLMKVIDALTAETAPATGDELALYDVSASATDKITLADLLKVVNALTEDTAPDGANDFVLTYDASASAAKKVKPANLPKGLVPIERKTGAGVASYDFATGIGATYRTYKLIGWLQPATDDVWLGVRISDDGGSTWEADAGDYRYRQLASDDGGTNRGAVSSGDTKVLIGSNDAGINTGNAADERIDIEITFSAPNSAAFKKMIRWAASWITSAGATCGGTGDAQVVAVAAINGVQLFFESGNIAAGDLTLYGVANA